MTALGHPNLVVCLKSIAAPMSNLHVLDLAKLLACLLRLDLARRCLRGLEAHVNILPGQVLGVLLDTRRLPKTILVEADLGATNEDGGGDVGSRAGNWRGR
jgi:hypothetical protein